MTNVVIGAGSGMGAEVARALAPRGPLILADVDLDAVGNVAQELGGDVTSMACDVTDQEQVDAVAARIEDLEALVITAGLSGSMANGRRIFEVNLIGMARVLATMEPLLRPGSVAVLFASMSGHRVPERADLVAVLDDPLATELLRRHRGTGSRPGRPAVRLPGVETRGAPPRSPTLPAVGCSWRPDPLGVARHQRHTDEPPRRVPPPDNGGHHQGEPPRPARTTRGSGCRGRVPDLGQGLVHDRERCARRRRHGGHDPR